MLTTEQLKAENLSTQDSSVSTGVDGKHRNANLDVLRGIAILLVLGHHVPFFDAWGRVGWAGVDLFFVLSGFLVSGLLFREWKLYGHLDIHRFYIRRAFKIWPTLYAYLAVFCLPILFFDRDHPGKILETLAITAAFGVNYFPNYCLGSVRHLWSLAVEEHFYLLLPVLLLALSRISKNKDDPFRALIIAFPAVAAIEIVLRAFSASTCVGQNCDTFSFPTHLRVDELLLGVSFAYLRYFRPMLFERLASYRVLVICAVLATTILYLLPSGSVPHAFGITVAYLGLGGLVPLAYSCARRFFWASLGRMFAVLGTFSYSIYVWHTLTVTFVPHRGFVGFGVYLLASLAVGWFFTELIESRALRLRDRLFPSRCRSLPDREAGVGDAAARRQRAQPGWISP